jgi:DNA-binding NtrC family response regulator
MTSKISVLILDDERQFTEELEEFFSNRGFQAYIANTGQEGLSVLQQKPVDLLILDVRLPGVNGLDILKDVKKRYPSVEVIVVSAHGDMDTVISALRLGALDYLRKPFRQLDLRIAMERTRKFLLLQQRLRLAEERSSLISKSLEDRIERNMIGVSDEIRRVLDQAMAAAEFSDTHVLITGESGTGKENIARIIHYASRRKDHLLYAVNSSSISETLMESEFFGHRKGSFTGALADKKGFFEVCDQGTLFLDEIADMPLTLQAKVLRAIEEKQIIRVGATEPVKTDFRIISATNHDLEKLVEEKRFRLDLLHRLNTLHIHIPPLRERTADIEPLLQYFINDFAVRTNRKAPELQKGVVAALMKYHFPGNIRELKNMVERAVILSDGGALGINDFPLRPRRESGQGEFFYSGTLLEHEIALIRSALQQHGYNQQAAARTLGISRDALIRKMEKYNIHIRKKEDPA